MISTRTIYPSRTWYLPGASDSSGTRTISPP
jgi:hypothetical protein